MGNVKVRKKRVFTDEELKLKLSEAAEKASAVHGDSYEYLEYLPGSKSDGKKTSLNVLCKEHGVFKKVLGHLLAGSGCPECGYARRTKNQTYTFSKWVERARETHGDRYTYLGMVEGTKFPTLKILCPDHGEFKTQAALHVCADEANGCPECGKERTTAALRFSDETTMSQLKERDPSKTYLGVVRIKNKRFFTGLCDKHGSVQKDVKGYMRGDHFCQKCGREAIANSSRYDFETFKSLATEVHSGLYEYVDFSETANNVSSTATIKCKKHGNFTQTAAQHLLGDGCPKCGNRVSKANTSLAKHLESLGVKVELEKKFTDVEGRIYADVFLPDFNLAIEHNGLRWHSSKFKDSSFSYNRKRRLEALGCSVLIIFEDEFMFSESKVLSLIESRIGLRKAKLQARKLTLGSVGLTEAALLLDSFHIQGSVTTGSAVGLFDNGKLVSVAVFNSNTSNRREKVNGINVELTRFCSSIAVQGGLSRLVKFYLAQNQKVQSVVSFSDNRLFTGKAYEVAGFRKVYETKQDYSYVVGKRRKHKSGFQKTRLLKLYPDLDPNWTEKQMTESLKIYRIYDCGKTKWEYRR
jgi:predicted  nucleic acid-binding Zn-ribbon protein